MHDLVDSHSHIDVAAFDDDRSTVIARARAAGVRRQVVPAIQASAWEPLRALCAAEPGLHPAYGLHPMYLDAHHPDDLDALADRARSAECIAIGECGLDFHVEGLDRERQRFYFERRRTRTRTRPAADPARGARSTK